MAGPLPAERTAPREVDTLWTIPNLFTLLRLLCLSLGKSEEDREER